ncbi:MAG: hypothetical protein CMO98_03405 [Woeseia sp.]|nr:hypothetical protein [Woeseia sp.]
MKFGLTVVALVLLSALSANFLLQDPGSVVIVFRGKIIEMSAFVLALLIFLLFSCIWATGKIIRAPRKLGEAAGRYRAGRAGRRLTRGVIEVAEGNFAKGERLLARGASVSAAPLLNYLQAARAAHLLGQDERRDTWLKQAYKNLPGAANAILLTQAELQLDQNQYEEALASLKKIEENTQSHSHALILLGRLYFRLQDWNNLGALLPKLTKQGRLDATTLEKWSVKVCQEELRNASNWDELRQVWKNTSRNLKQNLTLLETWFLNLMRTGQHGKAEKDLAAEVRRSWRPPLVRLYGLVQSPNPVRQLKIAEGWLKHHSKNPDLLLTAAQLCIRNKLWGKARNYLETVIKIRPTAEAYREYGHLLNELGDGKAAADAYRQGLDLLTRTPLPAIPHLQPETEGP